MPTCFVASGALLSHTFELESKLQTQFYATPAIIRFRVPTKAALQVYFFDADIYLMYTYTIDDLALKFLCV